MQIKEYLIQSKESEITKVFRGKLRKKFSQNTSKGQMKSFPMAGKERRRNAYFTHCRLCKISFVNT